MTLAELIRAIDSKKRIELQQAKEKACYDYMLADLIGYSIARIHSSAAKMPHISTVYPTLFDSETVEEQMQEKRDEMSVIRFKQFAQAFNKKFEEVGKTE